MELIKNFCKTCGGDLLLRDEQTYVCKNCKNEYAVEVAREHIDKMRRLFDETKLEAVANARRNLYEAVTAEYVSSTRVHECCAVLKQYLSDDFQANFYEMAISNDGRQIAKFIRGVDVIENAVYMETAIRFLIRSLQSEYMLVTGDLIERVFKNTNLVKYEKYSTELSVEAQKLDDCIYMTTYPRDVFVAYSSKDMDKVMDLVAYLEEQGLSCFVAVRNLRHGKGSVENYEQALQEAMDNCSSFVFVSTPNSRHAGCDALKKEIPYIKRKDTEAAPAEYRHDYARIPRRFKKHRVEYRVQESPRPMAADRIVAEFFDGCERVYSPEEVAERILNAAMEIETEFPVETHEPISETPAEKVKFCVGCKAECPAGMKFCPECGGNRFAGSLAEVDLLKKIEEMERERVTPPVLHTPIVQAPVSTPSDTVAGGQGAGLSEQLYDVRLLSFGDKKLGCIKVVRELTGLGLKDAKDLVEGVPSFLAKEVTLTEATRIRNIMVSTGSIVSIDKAGILSKETLSATQEVERKRKEEQQRQEEQRRQELERKRQEEQRHQEQERKRQEEQRRQEQLRQEQERKNQSEKRQRELAVLQNAKNNTTTMISNQIKERERVEALIAQKRAEVNVVGDPKRLKSISASIYFFFFVHLAALIAMALTTIPVFFVSWIIILVRSWALLKESGKSKGILFVCFITSIV